MTDDGPDVKVSRYWVHVCETGRHAALETPLEPWPDGNPIRRALDILAPDLAWQPNYRP
jgi:hypothetical protein